MRWVPVSLAFEFPAGTPGKLGPGSQVFGGGGTAAADPVSPTMPATPELALVVVPSSGIGADRPPPPALRSP